MRGVSNSPQANTPKVREQTNAMDTTRRLFFCPHSFNSNGTGGHCLDIDVLRDGKREAMHIQKGI